MLKLTMVLVAVAVAAVGAGAAHADAGGVLFVDRDRVECPNAEFVSIQEAVLAAEPGDKIKVCPDLYTESVTVDKPLWLDGQTGATQAEDCFAPAPADPTGQAIVTGGTHAFRLLANDIVLEGFVVQGSTIGIETSDAFSGYEIRHNLIQSNLLDGLELQSSGASETRVDHNCFRQNVRGGVVSEHGNLHNARIDHNASFRNFEGLTALGPGSRVGVSFDHNVAREDRFGISIQNSRASSVAHNSVESLSFPILVGGANVGLDVSFNRTRGGTNGILFRQTGFLDVFPVPSVGVVVKRNDVRNATLTGIGVVANNVHDSLFAHNESSDNGRHGIILQAANTGNLVAGNRTLRNAGTGIYANGATGNVFEGNHMFDNAQFDARDDTRPANVWTDNHCVTDFPPGTICGVG